MKQNIKLLLAAALFCGLSASAQTNTVNTPTSATDFPVVAASWLSSIDYTKAWPSNAISISVDALWKNNAQWGNALNIQKDFGNIVAYTEMDNEGLLNKIYRLQLGAGYRFLNRGDLSMQVTLGGGYDKENKTGFVEPAITLKKLMAHGAFSEISINYAVSFKGQQSDYPGLRVGTGFTF